MTDISPVHIGYETVTCGLCGQDYRATVIDHHISQPVWCESCLREVINEMIVKEKEKEKENENENENENKTEI